MTELVPYAVHYVFDGVRKHFFKLALHFSDVEAIHSASAHAYPKSSRMIGVHVTLEAARLAAQRLGITQVRWNISI
ncbi:DUF6555 family protein [Pseudomonas migulae]|uniref:DUF6555 family protein n=1 Tax=Pseudomonas migulae TaxID=78543 RepID=UPI0037184369